MDKNFDIKVKYDAERFANINFNAETGQATITCEDGGELISAKDVAQAVWSNEVQGDRASAYSPAGVEVTKDDIRNAQNMVVNMSDIQSVRENMTSIIRNMQWFEIMPQGMNSAFEKSIERHFENQDCNPEFSVNYDEYDFPIGIWVNSERGSDNASYVAFTEEECEDIRVSWCDRYEYMWHIEKPYWPGKSGVQFDEMEPQDLSGVDMSVYDYASMDEYEEGYNDYEEEYETEEEEEEEEI